MVLNYILDGAPDFYSNQVRVRVYDYFEGLFIIPLYLLQIWSENNSYCQSQMTLFSSYKTWKIINFEVGDKINCTLGVVQLF